MRALLLSSFSNLDGTFKVGLSEWSVHTTDIRVFAAQLGNLDP
jgi:hypothetical protein